MMRLSSCSLYGLHAKRQTLVHTPDNPPWRPAEPFPWFFGSFHSATGVALQRCQQASWSRLVFRNLTRRP